MVFSMVACGEKAPETSEATDAPSEDAQETSQEAEEPVDEGTVLNIYCWKRRIPNTF